MLNTGGEQPFRQNLLRFATHILKLHPHRGGPLHLLIIIRNGEAPLLINRHFCRRPDDFRIDEGDRLRLFLLAGHIYSHHALHRANLHGGKPHARRIIHGFKHIICQSLQSRVKGDNRGRNQAQTCIGQNNKRANGHDRFLIFAFT